MGEFNFVSLDWLAWIIPTLVGFWVIPTGFRGWMLAAVSLFFLYSVSPYSCGVLIVFTLISYLAVSKDRPSPARIKFSIGLILSVLVGFKILAIERSTEGDLVGNGVIPLGISFYSLRCIHLILERARGNVGVVDIRLLVSYLFFLPTLWVGPINRFDEFGKENRRHRWDGGLFSRGVERAVYGYVKVVIICGFFLQSYWPYWTATNIGEGTQLWQYFELVREGLTLYLLFSGFSDIAIAFSAMLGYRVGENFDAPYLASNISEFWRKWHISLTSWSRDYVYKYVMARSRSPKVGVLASLVVIGMWHELSPRYLAWALYHWLGIIVWQYFRRLSKSTPNMFSLVPSWLAYGLSLALTLHFVWLGFLLVKQSSITSMVNVVKLLFIGKG
ncbi:MBOAT family O-acyltransferase [Microbulbifer sp. Q7]|uniref:MBOAT family O-acyltransferase n=1 Tax=Microbulbifer sp. Q7 TaxID=1785091 RepID=UPI0009EEB3B8|nr:MBOAT family O-acyltransferase [Microbulbifer sp. Q7]